MPFILIMRESKMELKTKPQMSSKPFLKRLIKLGRFTSCMWPMKKQNTWLKGLNPMTEYTFTSVKIFTCWVFMKWMGKLSKLMLKSPSHKRKKKKSRICK